MTTGSTVTPMITVLMSCYNAAQWLDEAIRSILNQTYKHFEFVLIDDGSTDDTLSIINRYALSDPRIRMIGKKNTGLSDSLNMGIRTARGKWIARLDADDVALPSRLEEQVGFLSRNPEILLLGSCFDEMDGQGVLIKHQRYPSSHDRLLSNLEKAQRFFPHSSAMFATTIVQRMGGYNGCMRLSGDVDLWLRIAEQGKIACLNNILVKVRKHAQQISHHGSGKMQMLYSLAARTCHFLRSYSYVDPSAGNDGIVWRKFFEWVNVRIEEEGVFERGRSWAVARTEYFSAENKLMGTFRFAERLLKAGDIYRLMREKFLGSSLPKHLAREWMMHGGVIQPKMKVNR